MSPIGEKQHTMAAGSIPLRSTLNTNVITCLDMRKVCTEAVHCVALWTRMLAQILDMCTVCTEAVHCVSSSSSSSEPEWKRDLSWESDLSGASNKGPGGGYSIAYLHYLLLSIVFCKVRERRLLRRHCIHGTNWHKQIAAIEQLYQPN